MQAGSKLFAAALIVFGVGLGVSAFRPSPGTAQQPAPAGGAGGPKYTVVETEGTNLLVVDNASNTMYYYTVDPDKTVGDELKLRGSVDLNNVGKPTIMPKKAEK